VNPRLDMSRGQFNATVLAKGIEMVQHDERNDPSSPACLMHEFADELLAPPAGHGPDWAAVQAFRKTKRAELLARRQTFSRDEREHCASALVERLLATVDLRTFPVLGFYWPIRGELDLRPVARRHIDAGGVAALPVVVAKEKPVEFWSWEPAAAMQRGFWNIPVPLERRCVTPDVLLIPLVGYDSAGYRLGYGGGYYDRTLAALAPRPFCIGVAYDDSQLETIHPQPHDIPMNVIVTERRVMQFTR
jgi:5-formyltetrahydrofolate cyclo-ligase